MLAALGIAVASSRCDALGDITDSPARLCFGIGGKRPENNNFTDEKSSVIFLNC